MDPKTCPHPTEKQRRVPNELGPMLQDSTTGKFHAKVLAWAIHCDLCHQEFPEEETDERG